MIWHRKSFIIRRIRSKCH